jgi:DNA-binding transcriptional LysR family regulator
MDLRHLRYFVAVAEERNFSRAAARLRIAQPPLSMQVRALEEELGAPLFDRSRRPIELTAAGAVFYRDVRKVLADIDAAQERARKAGGGEIGSLRVAFIPPVAGDLLAEVLRTFREHYPKIEVTLSEKHSSEQVGAIERGEVDVGFLRRSAGGQNFQYEPVCKNRMVLAVPARHSLRRQKPIRWEHLRNEPLVMLSAQFSPGFYDDFLRKCGRSDLSGSNIQLTDEIHTVFWLVSAGFGVSPVIDLLRREARKDLVFIDLPDDAPQVEIVMARSTSNPNPVIARFFEVASAVLRKRRMKGE